MGAPFIAATLMLVGAATHVAAESFFTENFSGSDFENKWVQSTKRPDAGKWIVGNGAWFADEAIEKGMITPDDMKFYAISAKTEKIFDSPAVSKKPLVIQFTVKTEKREYAFCGGGYIKLMNKGSDQSKFDGDMDYNIMFGPDQCGYDVSRIHAIFNYDGENLLKTDEIKLDYNDKNEFTHLYTMVLQPNGEYEVLFDDVSKAKGKIEDDWAFPKKEIDDPEDKKPEDWVDEAEMLDPEDKKPEGYDDIPEKIADPQAKKPEDWDDEDDGEWEAPLVANPDFKGAWTQKKIPNPDYKGEWVPKKLPNPKYAPETYAAYKEIGVVGYELWIVNNGTIFDNIYVGDSIEEAKALADNTWAVIKDKEKDAKKAYDDLHKPPEPVTSEDDGEEEDDDEDDEDELGAVDEEKKEEL